MMPAIPHMVDAVSEWCRERSRAYRAMARKTCRRMISSDSTANSSAIAAVHRLRTGRRQIDNRQTTMTESDAFTHPLSLAIGTTMPHDIRHCAQHTRRHWCAVNIHDAGDPAHSGCRQRVVSGAVARLSRNGP